MNPIQDLSNFFIAAFSLSTDSEIGTAVVVAGVILLLGAGAVCGAIAFVVDKFVMSKKK